MQPPSEDRRRFPRVPSVSALLVRTLGAEDTEALSTTKSLGGGGCMFVYHTAVGVGSAVELAITVHGRVLKARGKVAWEAVKGPGWVEIGVEFLEVAPEDRPALDKLLSE
jgi:hypothetical protein